MVHSVQIKTIIVVLGLGLELYWTLFLYRCFRIIDAANVDSEHHTWSAVQKYVCSFNCLLSKTYSVNQLFERLFQDIIVVEIYQFSKHFLFYYYF